MGRGAPPSAPRRARAFLCRWWWRRVRRYRFEICRACGRPVGVVWAAESALWNYVMGGPDQRDDPGGVRCVPCFDAELQRHGLFALWSPGPLERFPQPFLAYETLSRKPEADSAEGPSTETPSSGGDVGG